MIYSYWEFNEINIIISITVQCYIYNKLATEETFFIPRSGNWKPICERNISASISLSSQSTVKSTSKSLLHCWRLFQQKTKRSRGCKIIAGRDVPVNGTENHLEMLSLSRVLLSWIISLFPLIIITYLPLGNVWVHHFFLRLKKFLYYTHTRLCKYVWESDISTVF